MFKKENSKNIINIDSIDVNNEKCYEIKHTNTYDRNIFGFIKHYSISKTIPFVFKSLDIAKDYCEIFPQYEKAIFSNTDAIGEITYQTYKFKLHNSNIYIEWEENSIIKIQSLLCREFVPNNKPIVKYFVKNIKLNNWLNTFTLSDIEFNNKSEMLSELANKNYDEHYSFELVSRI